MKRVADEEEADEAEAEDGEVRRHDVGGVLGPAEAGLDEGEAGLHEDHQDGADDDPQQVDLSAERGGRVSGVLRECRCCEREHQHADDARACEQLPRLQLASLRRRDRGREQLM